MRACCKWLLMVTVSASAALASAHGMHKHKPLAFEELPKICQQYFTRAEACYHKAGEKASFQQNNTKFLRQILPAADLPQREKMCQIAMDSFAEKTRGLNCE